MKGVLLAACVCWTAAAGGPELAALRAVPFTDVQVRDGFWSPRREVNRTVSLSHSLDKLEATGTIANFDLVAAGKREGYQGPVYVDSDLYKTLEAVSYSLSTDPDPALAERLESVIARVAAAQAGDGYLNTWYQVNAPEKRFTNLRDHHELYCAGHLFEAAVAHSEATGRRTLLDVATRYADLLCATFGEGEGKRAGYGGHPEVELALVKLSRATGRREYFDLAEYFLRARGQGLYADEHGTPREKYNGEYWQDNCRIGEHTRVVGHAVRFAYLMSAAVDVGVERRDGELLGMVDRVWRNTLERNTYLTGGVGPSARNEGFTGDYDLPNASAYQESCASVAMVMWNHRLALAHGEAKYADAVETALYNGVLAGVSQDGRRFFYVNPLESDGRHHRREWYGCACCPPNLCRTLAALGGYAYATGGEGLWVNLYIQGGVRTRLQGGEVALSVRTEYPWDGRVEFRVDAAPAGGWTLRLRRPGWCRQATLSVDGAKVEAHEENGYLLVAGPGAGGTVTLDLAMPVRRVEAHPKVAADRGRLAITRGPLVYCIEGVDSAAPVPLLAVPAGAELTAERRGGMVVIRGEGLVTEQPEWGAGLYRTAAPVRSAAFTAVPYYFWDNRDPGPMAVWPPAAPVSGAP